ncbi:hypothetical protein BH23GEM6_BH23GEM6_23480 [soil metagenome]
MTSSVGGLTTGGRVVTMLLACILLVPLPLFSQEKEERGDPPLLGSTDAFFALATSFSTVALAPLDARVAEAVQRSAAGHPPAVRLLAAGAEVIGGPGSLAIAGGLYIGGNILASPNLATTGVRTAEAVVMAEILVYGLKGLTGRARPRMGLQNPRDFEFGRGLRSGSYRSFPSAHTAAAFATATILTDAIGDGDARSRLFTGGLLYTGAALTGLSRIYTNQHWLTDTAVGGAIGTYSGWKVLQYHQSREGDTRIDRWLLSVTLVGGTPAGLTIMPLPVQ